MLTLILAESALERVPEPLWRHPSVAKHARRARKKPEKLLLDRSLHHAAMTALENAEKRGRPDIVHLSLLEALGTPLNKDGLLRSRVHTIDDHVIYVNPNVHLPRNYNRFVGLIEQLYEAGKVPPKAATLLEVKRSTLPSLVGELKPEYVVALTRIGKPKTLQEVAQTLSNTEDSVVIVGGFPHGHLTKETTETANELVSIDPEMLEAWTVTSRVIYEYERAVGLPEKRVRRL